MCHIWNSISWNIGIFISKYSNISIRDAPNILHVSSNWLIWSHTYTIFRFPKYQNIPHDIGADLTGMREQIRKIPPLILKWYFRLNKSQTLNEIKLDIINGRNMPDYLFRPSEVGGYDAWRIFGLKEYSNILPKQIHKKLSLKYLTKLLF